MTEVKPRLDGNKVYLQRIKHSGQFYCTIPRAIAGALKYKKGDVLEFYEMDSDIVIRNVTADAR